VGQSLSAGFRDGGLYREGQLTAFPNLVARQMGADFVQPLFGKQEGNGTGYKTVAETEPFVTYNMVTNNLAVSQRGNETIYNDFADKNNPNVKVDQLAFPEMRKSFKFLYPTDKNNKNFPKYINRAISDEKIKSNQLLSELAVEQNADLYLFELGADDVYTSIILGGGDATWGGNFASVNPAHEHLTMRRIAAQKSKGVILNVPEMLDCPYFKQISSEKLAKLNVKIEVPTGAGDEKLRPINLNIDRIIPTETTNKMMRNEFQGVVKLKDIDVIAGTSSDPEVEAVSPTRYNQQEIANRAKEFNWPVVDLYTLYKRIQAGNYMTDDGIKVNPAWPRGGNFFSADGIYPTAFGQAVIANEVIKTINKHYGTAIPLVQTRFFIK
jgi:hypothetical protein